MTKRNKNKSDGQTVTKRSKRTVVETRWGQKHASGREVRDDAKSYVKPPVFAKNEVQQEFLTTLKEKQVSVFIAPAGVGKSYLTMCECTDWLKKGYYDKIVISRPSVGMGNTLGLLKGGIREKYEPYLAALIDVICQRYGRGFYDNCINNGTIELQPLEYIRGRSLNCLVILDEAQNVTPDEMYTIMTRIGEGGKLVVIGDPTQNDIKGENGLTWLANFIQENTELQSHIGMVEATSDDIVRGGLCKKMVKAKERSLLKKV